MVCLAVKRRLSILFLSVATVCLSLPANANILVNPGFETPDVPAGSFGIFGVIPGWTSTFGPGIEIQDNAAGLPYEGSQLVELDSTANSGMSQTVATIAGALYTLEFAYSPRPGVAVGDNTIEVYFDGVLLATLDGAGAGNTVWTVYSYNVTPASTSAVIEFRASGTSNSLGGYLDAVEFDTAVPEPAAWALIGLGLFTLGVLKRRRLTR